MSEAISTRETGKLPLSIGTSLAVESFLGISEEVEHKTPPLPETDEFWINARTLVRNIIQSVSTGSKSSLQPNDVLPALKEEIDFIVNEVKQARTMDIVVYITDLDLSKYNMAKRRVPKTPKQIHEDNVTVGTLKLLHNDWKTNNPTNYIHEYFKPSVKALKPTTRVVILTHITLDLLAWRTFKTLKLLESHTGKIKGRELWYTKYFNAGKRDLSRIPFTEKLLQIFGDKECFSPMDVKFINAVLEIANKYNWTPLSTDDKVNYGMSRLNDHFLYDYYNSL